MIANDIFWQAHRGGGAFEAPDNTMAALEYGWALGGVPEVDIRLTADDELICLHDNTLARTTDAPDSIAHAPVRRLTLAEITRHDAGTKFDPQFAGQHVPSLREVFEKMRGDSALELFVDIKNYDEDNFPRMLKVFAALTAEFNLAGRLIVASRDYDLNVQIGKAVEGLRVMQWIGASGATDHRAVKLAKFEELAEKNFAGLAGVQVHLEFHEETEDGWHYDLSKTDLQQLLKTCTTAGIFFQVFPFHFNEASLRGLLQAGIKSYATDEPKRFKQILEAELPG
ncbi:MAG: glycerophosphodiester phosphodiesterase [Phycisphaerae bacterium]|nr:glycerophosphodiester phosphodiesterase [Phycisphaerae bacterium]